MDVLPVLHDFTRNANPGFSFRMRDDSESAAAQHGFYRSVIGYPPVRRIVGIFLLDEVHRRKIGIVKNVFRPKRIVVSPLAHSFRSSNHGLKQQLAADLLDHRSEERRVGKECRSRWWR